MADLNLQGIPPISMGGTRICYPHPEDPRKCIKVYRSGQLIGKKTIRRRLRVWLANRFPALNTNWHEYRFWQKYLQNGTNPLSTFFPKFYELVQTDNGIGLILEFIQDEQGQACKNLIEWYPTASPHERAQALQQIKHLTDAIIEQKLPCYDWGPGNFLVQTSGNRLQLKLIDFEGSMGNNEFIPISTLIPALRRSKIRRRIQRGIYNWLEQFD
jgi:hypothetical protein